LVPAGCGKAHPVKRGLAGFVLGAGSGTRLRPLTDELPKALCPVGNVPLVDIALARVSAQVLDVAVNAHSTAPALVQHLDGANVRVSVEYGDRLGTAGAIGNMRRWLDGRDVLIHNADAYVTDDLSTLLEGWTGERPRLLVKTGRSKSDFGCRRFCGVSLLPGPIAAQLKP